VGKRVKPERYPEKFKLSYYHEIKIAASRRNSACLGTVCDKEADRDFPG